jgi:hypothetical protein
MGLAEVMKLDIITQAQALSPLNGCCKLFGVPYGDSLMKKMSGVIALLSLLTASTANAQTLQSPSTQRQLTAKPTYEQLEHQLAVTQELANAYYMRAIQAEAQLTQLRAEQSVTDKENSTKSPKK